MDREALLEAVERDERLDRVAERLDPLAQRIKGAGRRRDVLSGTWLGHPLHPSIVLAPLSFFLSATALDVVGGRAGRRLARRLLGLGLVTSLPAAAAGVADWSDTAGAEKRVGVVHAAANGAALACYAASWRQRGRGANGRGTVTGLVGSALLGLGGYLGGHLSYRRGVGVDTTTFSAGPTDWRSLGRRLEDLPEDRPTAVESAEVPLLVVRRGASVSVLEARCTHRGGPLQDGELVDGCVRCPWHGSTFRLDSGRLVSGPGTAPQPAYEVRVRDGVVEVRREEPGSLRRVAATVAERADT